jgi:hypothetical protein
MKVGVNKLKEKDGESGMKVKEIKRKSSKQNMIS